MSMETVKELAKILEECDCRHSAEHCDICPYIGEEGCLSYFETARKLVEHGVTIATDTNVGDKWVSVDERLPEKTGMYIVCTAKNAVYCAKYYSNGRSFGTAMGTKVTHWQPLPALPKGVQ